MTFDELDYKLWSTKITRFNAAKRLNNWKNLIRISLLIVSIYLLILSIITFSGKVKDDYKAFADFINICLSVVTFSFGLAVNLNDLESKSKKQHECGRKISALLDNLENTETSINRTTKEYDIVLDQFENHSTIDFYLFCLHQKKRIPDNKKNGMPNWFTLNILTPIVNYWLVIISYIIIIVIPAIFIIGILKFA